MNCRNQLGSVPLSQRQRQQTANVAVPEPYVIAGSGQPFSFLIGELKKPPLGGNQARASVRSTFAGPPYS